MWVERFANSQTVATGGRRAERSATLPTAYSPLSSRGLGRRPLTAETGVRIPVAVLQTKPRVSGAFLLALSGVGHARSGCALVLVLLAAGSGQGHAASTRTRLVYRMDVAGSVDPTVTAKTLAVLERRADDAFAGDARVTARGRRLVVDTGHNVSRGQASALAETGRLVFYDWEPNVIGP